LRNKDAREIDFFITKNEQPSLMIEVKWRDEKLTPNFAIFNKHFDNIKKIQLVKELKRGKPYPDGTEIRKAHHWLSDFKLA
jgi:hypothetical protein